MRLENYNLDHSTVEKKVQDRMEDARALASELNVYDTIRSKVETEMRERASQIKYNAENERR